MTPATATTRGRGDASDNGGSPARSPAKRSDRPLVRVRDLQVHFPLHAGVLRRQVGTIKAVENVSFDIQAGETLGLVGESGCGKTTVGRAILRLYELTGGSVEIDSENVFALGPSALLAMRQKMQMIFQDPQACLNPRMTVGSIIAEPLVEHKPGMRTADRRQRVAELMASVGLEEHFANRYPHEFSGGQRQRIGIARALALDPKFIVCDEPIAALDVSIQAQVVNLLEDLQRKHGLTYLFISHDLSMVRHLATRVAVMYLGHIVEMADGERLYANPRHPYTRALLSAVPHANPDTEAKRERIILKGDVPNPANPPRGCSFCTRCPHAKEVCFDKAPKLTHLDNGHAAACHFVEEL